MGSLKATHDCSIAYDRTGLSSIQRLQQRLDFCSNVLLKIRTITSWFKNTS